MIRSLVLTVCLSFGLFAGAVAQFSLSGKITNPNGVGIANVNVDLFDSNGNPVGILTDKTDALGNYNLNQPFGLPGGTYDVAFKPPAGSGLAPVINPGYVLSGNQVLNDTVPFGFTLSGYVRDTAGLGLADIDLNITDELTGQLVYTPNPTDNTDSTGFYSLVIAPGVYTLTYRPIAGQKLVAVEFKGVVFNTNQARDVVLQPGFFVSGTVLDNTSQPVKDADLDFDISATKTRVPTPNDNTDNNGFYQVVVAAGIYDITVEPQVADKLVGQRKFSVPVTKDTVVDFTLQPGLYLSGLVRRASDFSGVANVDLDVYDTTAANTKIPTPFDFTDVTGAYQIVVPAGTFNVAFQPPVSSGLASVESLRISVTTDRTLNATLPSGFTLSGSVQRTGGGGLPNIDVKFLNSSTGTKVILANHFTNALGNYAVVAVPGTYTVRFEPPQSSRRLAQEFLNFVLSTNMTLNVALDSGRSVSGFVKDSLNNPIFDVDFDAFTIPNGNEVFTPSDNTDSTGFYQVIVPAANLDLAYTPTLSTRFAGVSFAQAPITNDTTINLILRHGVLLSGTVRDSASNPQADVKVRAFGSPEAPLAKGKTDTAGAYAGILVPGTYDLLFIPLPNSGVDSLRLSAVGVFNDTVINPILPSGNIQALLGDVTDDRAVDVLDIVSLIQLIFYGVPVANPNVADVNNDTTVDVVDVVCLIQNVFFGNPLPC